MADPADESETPTEAESPAADSPAVEGSENSESHSPGEANESERTDESGQAGPTDESEQEATEPGAHTTDERRLTASVQLIWAVRVLVAVGILGLVGGLVAREVDVDPTYAVAVAGGLAVFGLAWVHLRYRVWRFRVREDALYLERGVITNVRTVAPHVRIQHVDTSRGPLERALGLSTLVVYTAGSRGADVSIPGLTTDEAADLQQRVKELAIAAEGGDAL